MSNLFGKIYSKLSFRLLDFMDEATDRRICGRSLAEIVPSLDRDDEKRTGGTPSQSTHYIILKRIFSHVRPEASDTLIDVGCGKGRVLAYLASIKCPCRLYGIERNEAVGKIAQGWAARYPNVHVMIGDAFAVDYNDYTILSVANPFFINTRLAFIEYLESHLRHPITLLHWYGAGTGFEGRAGWTLKHREKLDTIHGLKVVGGTQYYYIWQYDPAQRA